MSIDDIEDAIKSSDIAFQLEGKERDLARHIEKHIQDEAAKAAGQPQFTDNSRFVELPEGVFKIAQQPDDCALKSAIISDLDDNASEGQIALESAVSIINKHIANKRESRERRLDTFLFAIERECQKPLDEYKGGYTQKNALIQCMARDARKDPLEVGAVPANQIEDGSSK